MCVYVVVSVYVFMCIPFLLEESEDRCFGSLNHGKLQVSPAGQSLTRHDL